MNHHAYLILAHTEFELLQVLITCLDDERNELFVHFDKKIKSLPDLYTKKAKLNVLQKRFDVRWGDVSVIEAEFALFEEALSKGPYLYYHLLSGVDLPIKSQDYIHRFFDNNFGKEFVGYTFTTMQPEIVRKCQRWHLFPRLFKSKSLLIRGIRHVAIRIQETLGIKRNDAVNFKKGPQWVSITDKFAHYLVDNKAWALKTFTHSFCSDEIFIQTLCWNSTFKSSIFSTDNDEIGSMRAIGWRNGQLYDWRPNDFDLLLSSPALFARKFNMKDPFFIMRVVDISRTSNDGFE